jgi:hypothetical protein
VKTQESSVEHVHAADDRIHQDPAEIAKRIYQASQYPMLKKLHCEFADGALIISGHLPSFHLKQLAQTMIRNVDGVTQIVNAVHVRRLD